LTNLRTRKAIPKPGWAVLAIQPGFGFIGLPYIWSNEECYLRMKFMDGYEVVKKVKMWPPTDPTGFSSRNTRSFPGGRVMEKY
jgi:hypothetical protein